MAKLLKAFVLVAFATLSVAAPVIAQQRSTVDVTALDAAVAARPDRNRAIVTSALMSADGLAVAERMGVSRDALTARIAALDDASAQKVADQLLAGGDQTIVISTTAIIIALLLIILLTR